jgi:hypothetical protein
MTAKAMVRQAARRDSTEALLPASMLISSVQAQNA